MKKKSLGLNAFLNSLRSILNLVFPLITFPYVSRVLSIDGMGIYNFANTYVSYFLLLAGLGISTYAVREGAKYRDDKKKIQKFASQVFTINMYSTLVSYVLLIATICFFKELFNYRLCILIFSIQIFFTTIGMEWIYIIYEDYSYITIRSIIFKIVSIILLFVFVRDTNDYLQYATITVIAVVGSNVFNYIHIKKFCKIQLLKETNWKHHLKPILIIFASLISVTLYVSSDTTILGLMKGNYAVGVYSISVKIYQMAEGILSALLTVTIPRLSMLFGKKRISEYYTVLSKIINCLSLLVIPTTVGLIMLSKEIIIIIAGSKYLVSVSSLRIIGCSILFSIFSWIFSDCVLIPSKHEMKVLQNTVITAVINILLNLILIPIFSYNGTALSTVIAELMVMILNAKSCWKTIRNIILSRSFFINIISSIVGCIGITIICIIFQLCLSEPIFIILSAVIIAIITYIIILILLKNNIIIDLIKRLKEH